MCVSTRWAFFVGYSRMLVLVAQWTMQISVSSLKNKDTQALNTELVNTTPQGAFHAGKQQKSWNQALPMRQRVSQNQSISSFPFQETKRLSGVAQRFHKANIFLPILFYGQNRRWGNWKVSVVRRVLNYRSVNAFVVTEVVSWSLNVKLFEIPAALSDLA